MYIKRTDVVTEESIDAKGSIFKTTGDQAIIYCSTYEESVRTSYTDGNSLYPKIGDAVATYEDGRREIIPQ